MVKLSILAFAQRVSKLLVKWWDALYHVSLYAFLPISPSFTAYLPKIFYTCCPALPLSSVLDETQFITAVWSILVIQSLQVYAELPFPDRYWRRFTEIVAQELPQRAS